MSPKQQKSSANARAAGKDTRGRGQQPNSNQRTLRDYFLMIRERWFLGFATAGLLVGLLAAYQLSQPQVYEAEASLMFESNNPQVVDIKEVVDTSLQSATVDARLQTHIGQVKSTSFFNYVADTFPDDEKAMLKEPYLDPDEAPPTLEGIVLPGIEASLKRGTFILTVSARHRNADAAALLANRYATKYIEYNRERTASGNMSAISFLEEQAEELLQKVDRSESALQDYRRKHNLVSLEENQNIVLRRLDSLSSSVVEARVARLGLDSQLEHVEAYLANEKDLKEVDYIASYGSISDLRRELDKLEGERSLLEERYLERHPDIIQNTQSIDNIRKQLDEQISMAVTELKSRHRRALSHEQKLQEALIEAENESLELEEIAVRYNVLRRQAEADRESYARIVDRLSETRIASQLDEINIKMVDTASRPYIPIEPNLQKLILQSAFLGCFVFLGLPLGLGMLDNKLKAAWEVELLLGLPLLGEVPRITNLKKRDRPHIISQATAHSACEAFRGIFSQMKLNSTLEKPNTILLTSTLPGEGKSFVASNLAATFAAHGKRTLLVDCDFRRPSLHFYYERRNDRGIIRWLEMEEPGKEALEPYQALDILLLGRNLHLLRAGGERRNPTEMFDQNAFKALFEQLRKEYDIILIDTPPVGIFPDALLLAGMCDQILYVCQFNRVNKTQIRKFLEKVELTNTEMSGLVLNGIPTGRTSTYYDYYGYGQAGNREYQAYYNQKR